MKLRITLTVLAVMVLGVTATAQADTTCLCSMSYVIRPCSGSLTKVSGSTASKRVACSRASTRIKHLKDSNKNVADEKVCVATCKASAQAKQDKIVAGAECKSRPGQKVITKWKALGGGGKKWLEIERKSVCPGKDKVQEQDLQ